MSEGSENGDKKSWMYVPPKPQKSMVPDHLKSDMKAGADEFVESLDYQWSYPVYIFRKWHQRYFYFCVTWRSPRPDAISEYFESRFARLEYAGDEKFDVAYMRHTGLVAGNFSGPYIGRVPRGVEDQSSLPISSAIVHLKTVEQGHHHVGIIYMGYILRKDLKVRQMSTTLLFTPIIIKLEKL